MSALFFADRVDTVHKLTGEDAYHISRSLRMKPGEFITIATPDGLLYECEITRRVTAEFEANRERREDCPLVELPPHGRLIDANSLSNKFEWIPFEDLCDYRRVIEEIDNAPTIVEASNDRT